MTIARMIQGDNKAQGNKMKGGCIVRGGQGSRAGTKMAAEG